MAGNDYYQMVFAHSLVETAVYARLWGAFEDWLVSDNSDDISDISKFASDLSSFWEMVNMRSSVSCENETRNAVMVSLDKVMKVFNRFLQQCTSPTSKLWLMYMEMMDIVRRYTSMLSDLVTGPYTWQQQKRCSHTLSRLGI